MVRQNEPVLGRMLVSYSEVERVPWLEISWVLWLEE